MKKTQFFNKVERKWVLIDAKDMVLGRLSTRIAKILQGKTKATYTPNFLCGDKVIVINAKHIKITGNKLENKNYDRYSGYPGGIKEISLKRLQEKNPSRVLYCAVKGMLPRTLLAKRMIRGLKIYAEDKHDQEAQQPVKLEV
ncbi:MAG: 50S ribosomal protein L13 [Candidatus Omnitrophica bacterium]|nr:50S ribosomal protein L13 [Candidatus Omnitrophota bacterium]